MKSSPIIKTLGVACLLAPSLLHAVPTEIARESFEGAPGSIGFTTSVPQFVETATSAFTDYFSIIPNNGTKISGSRTLPGADGASIFAAEDCDTPRTAPATQGPQEVSLTTNSVNIAGKINTQVRLLMAAPGRDTNGTVNLNEYENFTNSPLNINKLRVEASIDGGAFQRIVQFSPTVTGVATTLSFDSDGNNIGGDTNPITTNPTTLNASFQEGIYSIPTGNTVQIRVTLESDATGELIAFDNIRIFGEGSATAPPAIAGVPAGNLIFTEGGTAAAIAPALTVTDADSANLASASVVLSQGFLSTEDVLAATPSGSILAGNIVYTTATGTLTIIGAASLADYQAVLRSVTYRNTNTTNPSTSVRRATFLVNDGTNPSNSPIRDINVVDNIATQTIPFTESFETDGRGTRYAVTARVNALTPNPSFFDRTQPTDVTNLDGTWAYTIENVDDNPDSNETVAFNFNTAGFTTLTGKLRVAAPGGAVYDGGSPDFLAVEATTDGSTWNRVIAFYPLSSATSTMAVDTNNDNIGDGAALTSVLQEFTFSLPTGATTMGLRMRAFSNITSERILFDKLDVEGRQISFAINDSSGAENTTPRSFTVTRAVTGTGATGSDTVNFATANGTATSGSDYTANSGTLTFTEGETTKTINVAVSNDSTVELNETFTVGLSSASRGTITDATGDGTITNDDTAILTFSAASVTEGDTGTTTLNIPYSLSNPVDVSVSASISTLGTGTATAGTDFTAISGQTLTITSGTTSGNISISVAGDRLVELNETINARASTLASGGRDVTFTAAATTSDFTGTINNDDIAITPGAFTLNRSVGSSAKVQASTLVALATGGEGPITLTAVQAATNGSTSLADGWVFYEPNTGSNSNDAFTYTLNDGFNSVTGTVTVNVMLQNEATVNVTSMTREGDGMRLNGFGIPGRSYKYQYSNDLSIDSWTDLGSSAIVPPNGAVTVLDPGPLPPTRFYRLVQTTP